MANTPSSATIPRSPLSAPPRRRRLWLWGAIGAGVLVAAAWFWWTPLRGYALTGTSYGARVACSCRFVGGRPLGDCRKDMERAVGWVSLSEDAGAKSVTASYPLIASQTATYREGWGCQLEPWK